MWEAYNDQGDIIIDHPLAMLKLKNITPKLLVLVPFCLCKGSVETYVTFIHFPQTYCTMGMINIIVIYLDYLPGIDMF